MKKDFIEFEELESRFEMAAGGSCERKCGGGDGSNGGTGGGGAGSGNPLGSDVLDGDGGTTNPTTNSN